jgi:alcohol dehydrogenase class IV
MKSDAPTFWEFATANRILFGAGMLRKAPTIIASWGKRVLLVTGKTPSRAEPLAAALRAAGFAIETFSIPGEPAIPIIREGIALARTTRMEAVVAFGGGSALDAGKAIASLAANEGDLLDYLEVIGKGMPLPKPGLPCLAIPTTAGTGAEVTRNAVIASPEHRLKASLRSPFLLPRAAIVDPELTHGLPPSITAVTGMDALTQLIEPFVSPRANPMTDALCREGMARIARSLRQVFRDGSDAAAREDMALASLFGGIALANAGLGAVHGFAAPVGGMFEAPHGAVCAALLAPVTHANVAALRSRAPGSPALARYREVARILTGKPDASEEEGVTWLAALCRELGIPALSAWGGAVKDFDEVARKAAASSSMKGNPVALGQEELVRILQASG